MTQKRAQKRAGNGLYQVFIIEQAMPFYSYALVLLLGLLSYIIVFLLGLKPVSIT